MKVLFVCNQNENRSKTAERLFKDRHDTKSAGLYTLDVKNLLTENMLKWAEVVIVMDDEQRSEIAKRFPKIYMQKRILSLDIDDIYSYNDPLLVNILEKKMGEIMPLAIH